MRIIIRFFFRLYYRFLSSERDVVKRIQSVTGFIPANPSIFKQAFSHKSNNGSVSSDGNNYAIQNNERLEYLGDAVLGTIIAEYLFKKYPGSDEGFLTKMRSKIVKRKTLNEIGERMQLDAMLSDLNSTKLSRSMFGNAVEALVGAVYLEKGYKATKRFVIKKMLQPHVDVHHLEEYDDNYKSQLLEFCQKNSKSIEYKLVKRYKHEKRDRFHVAVHVDGKELASAHDFNKKSAEQAASEKALNKLGLKKVHN